jgi:subtilisin-like proprotein convertase family protein
MKKQISTLTLALVALASRADVTNLTATVNSAIPVNNYNPVPFQLAVGNMSGTIDSFSVNLNITGGFNGDLYAYLLSPDNTMVVLMNRVGLDSFNSIGYVDTGFDITLTAAGNNIHFYQDNSPAFSGGQLTGTWAPDQRTIDPYLYTDASLFDAAPTGNNFNSFYGATPNGTWTLAIADGVNSANQPTLVSWGMTIQTVPEPQTCALLGCGLAALGWLKRHRRK